ncbi:MAG: SMC-Scp complex subunit ScpB [Minisyncoccia bacterium]
MDSIQDKIEAILFYKAEPTSREELKRTLKISIAEINAALDLLKQKWNGGVAIIDDGESLSLATSSSVSPLIDGMRKEELEKDLGKASLETLTIVLYKGPISRREIDYIRGVQSQYILRALVSRGLIERLERSGEGYVYKPTHELLGLLGIRDAKELPDYGTLTSDLDERLESIKTEDFGDERKENEESN